MNISVLCNKCMPPLIYYCFVSNCITVPTSLSPLPDKLITKCCVAFNLDAISIAA